MTRLHLRQQICMVVGYMLNRIKAYILVRLYTWWYYIKNPDMYSKRRKLEKKLRSEK